ncbi:MAG TPA: ABC transporter ATP-binding protein [Candidatus Polarisedimenticolia bacterium]|nr:ABC transporter ATP-binding protein [Candidatus Polarisedimenticolia bacterium]
MDEAFVRFDDVHKAFGAKGVLEGITFEIRRGETMVVLGGSGSGKSVLIRHIIGLHRPDSGHVIVDGEDIVEYDEDQLIPIRKKVAMLFQGGALFDSMNVRENVAYGLREHTDLPEEAVRQVVRDKLELVELEGVEDLMPSELSGGMKKRVALARSIAMDPQCILYDEPTTGLDPVTANTINDLIRNLQERLDVTSVVVTHDIQSAFFVGDRIGYLYEGKMYFVGTVEEARATNEPRLRHFLDGGRVG